jgi:hypothetical protein
VLSYLILGAVLAILAISISSGVLVWAMYFRGNTARLAVRVGTEIYAIQPHLVEEIDAIVASGICTSRHQVMAEAVPFALEQMRMMGLRHGAGSACDATERGH